MFVVYTNVGMHPKGISDGQGNPTYENLHTITSSS